MSMQPIKLLILSDAMEPGRAEKAWEPKALVQRLYAGRVPKVPSPKPVKPCNLYSSFEDQKERTID